MNAFDNIPIPPTSSMRRVLLAFGVLVLACNAWGGYVLLAGEPLLLSSADTEQRWAFATASFLCLPIIAVFWLHGRRQKRREEESLAE